MRPLPKTLPELWKNKLRILFVALLGVLTYPLIQSGSSFGLDSPFLFLVIENPDVSTVALSAKRLSYGYFMIIDGTMAMSNN